MKQLSAVTAAPTTGAVAAAADEDSPLAQLSAHAQTCAALSAEPAAVHTTDAANAVAAT